MSVKLPVDGSKQLDEQFDQISRIIREDAGHLGSDIRVHGSRTSGTAGSASDIDIAIRVSPTEFDRIVSQRFGVPNLDSAKERTMQHAIKTGKIQAGEAGLRGLRKRLQDLLGGMKVDLSIIKKGGQFDNGPWIPLR